MRHSASSAIGELSSLYRYHASYHGNQQIPNGFPKFGVRNFANCAGFQREVSTQVSTEKAGFYEVVRIPCAHEQLRTGQPAHLNLNTKLNRKTVYGRRYMADDEQRRRWRKYSSIHSHIAAAWAARGFQRPPPRYPAMPADLVHMTCSAKARAGTPCKLTALHVRGQ